MKINEKKILNWIDFVFIFRPRRRSGSSIVVLGGSDSIDDYIKSDTIEHYRITDGTYRDSHDIEMLTMMPVNQDNGMYFNTVLLFRSIFFNHPLSAVYVRVLQFFLVSGNLSRIKCK